MTDEMTLDKMIVLDGMTVDEITVYEMMVADLTWYRSNGSPILLMWGSIRTLCNWSDYLSLIYAVSRNECGTF